LGLGGRHGTVTVIEQSVSRNYARRALISFFVVGGVVALLAATVASHYMHPILGALFGTVIGAMCGATVGVIVFAWPVLRVFWHWAIEIIVGLAVVYGWTGLMQATSLPVSLLVVVLVVGIPTAVPQVRRTILAVAWCVIVRHRLRMCFSQFIITNRHGSVPLILAARPTPAGERVWVWLRPGQALSDLEGRTDKLAVTCWANEVRVTLAGRRAALLQVDVTRRNPLADKVSSPLPEVVKKTWDALNHRFGRTGGIPINAPTSPGMPPTGLDLPEVTDNDVEDSMPKPRGRKNRNPRSTSDDDDSYGSNNADWA